jgi:hypothetical protein
MLEAFQTYLVEKGLNSKTINNNINGAIKPIFTNLLLKGAIKQTPFIPFLVQSVPSYSPTKIVTTIKVRYTLGSRKWRTFGPKPNGKGVRGNSVPDVRWNLKEWMREHPQAKSRTLPREPVSGFLTGIAYKAVQGGRACVTK